jgi:uncharacterized membrane protein
VSESELRVPTWAIATTFLLSLIGLGLSTYLTITHFEPHLLVCPPIAQIIDCQRVTTSAQSNILGVPVAILGLGNYLVMTVLNSPWAWHSKHRWIHEVRFILAIVSMAFVLWLIYAELIIIGSICLYCTSVHVVTFAILVVLTIVSPTQLGWARSRAS